MRLLVACPQCGRQFDAGGRPIGGRFRCHCGTVVTIRKPRGHDARVVRCSSCGAPRQQGGVSCGHCGADFTLHERDLHTVCPKCFAHVSDRARFCHHCGLALHPEPLIGEKTSLACPTCGRSSRLGHRQLGGVAVLECGRCAGFWLGNGVFSKLVERASRDALGVDWCEQMVTSSKMLLSPSQQRGPRYRQCPYCGKLMTRRHYGRGSGVIIDVCREHGVWFDPDELPRILAWVRSGGLAKANQEAADGDARQKRLDKIARNGQQREPFTRELHEADKPLSPVTILVDVVAALFH